MKTLRCFWIAAAAVLTLACCTNNGLVEGFDYNADTPAVINLTDVAQKPGFGTAVAGDKGEAASDKEETRATTVGTDGVPVSAWTEGDKFQVTIIGAKGNKRVIVYYHMTHNGSGWQKSFSNAMVVAGGGGAPTKITTEAAALAALHELAATAGEDDKLSLNVRYERHYSDPGTGDAVIAPLANNHGTEEMMATDVRVNGNDSEDDSGNSLVFPLSSIYAGNETEGVMTVNIAIGGWQRTTGLVIVENVAADNSAWIEDNSTSISGSGQEALNTIYLHAPAGTYDVMLQGDTPKTLAEDLAVAASTYYVIDASLGAITPGNPVANQDYSYDPTYTPDGASEAVGKFTVYTGKGLKEVSDLINDSDNSNGTLASHITLANNIDMSAYDYSSDDKMYTPIGNSSTAYTGTFEGNDKTITNLIIGIGTGNKYSDANCGLVGKLGSGGKVQNVILDGVSIYSTDSNVGGIVGMNQSGSISNCTVNVGSGGIGGDMSVGGIVGLNKNNSKVDDCKVKLSSGNITGNDKVGGIAGENSLPGTPTITNCEVTGSDSYSINGSTNVNVFVGKINGGTVSNNKVVESAVKVNSTTAAVGTYSSDNTKD